MFLQEHMLEICRLRAQRAQAQVNESAPMPVRPLVDQLRDHLATLPPAQKERISIPAILPHLQGKYRQHPHYIQVAKALKIIGYTPVRSHKKADAGCRYWIAPKQINEPDGEHHA
jgi:hypothetical protein